MLPMFVATFLITIGALLITTPLGLASAILHRFYLTPKIKTLFKNLIQLMSGIPSVVIGLWGLMSLTPLFGHGWHTASMVLALMILPTMSLLIIAQLEQIPKETHQAALALGISTPTTIYKVLLPSCRSGIFSALVLSAARAIGETMAVLMVCGNVVQYPNGLTTPLRTITSNIALEMGYADSAHRAMLILGGLLLMFCVAVLLLTSTFFQTKLKRR